MPTLHIAIVGGGAAGLFAAITAKHYYPDTDVCIFEKNNKETHSFWRNFFYYGAI